MKGKQIVEVNLIGCSAGGKQDSEATIAPGRRERRVGVGYKKIVEVKKSGIAIGGMRNRPADRRPAPSDGSQRSVAMPPRTRLTVDGGSKPHPGIPTLHAFYWAREAEAAKYHRGAEIVGRSNSYMKAFGEILEGARQCGNP